MIAIDKDTKLIVNRSINEYFRQVESLESVTRYYPNQAFDPTNTIEWFAIRTGKFRSVSNRNTWLIYFKMNILICVPTGGDIYAEDRLIGLIENTMTKSIPVMVDDEAIGCFKLLGDIRTNKFGQIKPELKISQSTIEADFSAELESDNDV